MSSTNMIHHTILVKQDWKMYLDLFHFMYIGDSIDINPVICCGT